MFQLNMSKVAKLERESCWVFTSPVVLRRILSNCRYVQKCRYAKMSIRARSLLSISDNDHQTHTANMISDMVSDMLSVTAADVERRLDECVDGGGASPKMYRVVKVIEFIEGVKNTVAASRWASIKKQAGDVAIPGHRGAICVNEEGLEKVLLLTKECELKTVALSTRGHVIDEMKVREVILHAGNTEISVQVL
jgi:hypothetical protein